MEVGDNYKKFYWFEMKDKDLYWGPSGKVSKNFICKELNGDSSVTFDIQELFDSAEKVNMKFSYHESGYVHMKHEFDRKTEYYDQTRYIKTEQITGLKRFFTLISKSINYYEPYNKELTKGDSNAIVFKINSDKFTKRHYFEFFISRPGAYPTPQVLLNINSSVEEAQPIIISLNNDFILVIRHIVMEEIENDHNADKEMFFIEA